jgi:hypothetical protein
MTILKFSIKSRLINATKSILLIWGGLILGACGSDSSTTTHSTTIPNPSIEGPIAGTPSLQSTSFDLATAGYQQSEYFISGQARNFVNTDTLQSNGKWNVRVAGNSDFKTRIVVYRPVDASAFNGTVVIEWLNVSAGPDAAPDWLMAHNEMIRKGYAWVGVSAQAAGIDGGGYNLTGLSLYLKALNPQRYSSLLHPGDTYSFDMFSQAAQAVLYPQGVDPLGGLHVQRAIAAGESQSAAYMLSYVNAIAPIANLFDGYFIHSRGHGSAKLSQAPLTDVATPAIVHVRDDLDVPVMMLQTETDLFILGSYQDRQPDTATFRLWEVAGIAHADIYSLQGASDRGTDPTVANVIEVSTLIPGILSCAAPINSGPQHFVVSAALAALENWLRTGAAPAYANRIEVAGDEHTIARDSVGNALGGIRTPYVDAPIARLSGEGQTGNVFCSLFGSTQLLSKTTLDSLYPNHATYVAAVNTSVDGAVNHGFLLAPDGDLLKTWAAASNIGNP